MIAVVVAIGTLEVMNLLFKGESVPLLKYLFCLLSFAVFAIGALYPHQAGLALALAWIIFAVIVILQHSKFTGIEKLQAFIAKATLGFIYIGFLPSFSYRIMDLPHGMWWFWVLMSVVFGGDIGAYVFGTLFGKTKLIPTLSPKKTVQGSGGGLLSSVVGILICHQVSSYVSWQGLIVLALIAGVAAQIGDFFESLLKRLANVKDSGHIMPGHGGVLDRIDGILFASPVLFIGALFLEGLL